MDKIKNIFFDFLDNLKIFVIFVLCAFFSCWTSGYSWAGVWEYGLGICLIIALFLTAVELFSVTIDSIVRRGFVDIIINAVCLIASIFLLQLIVEKWNLPTEDWLLVVWILIIFNVLMLILSAIKPFFDDDLDVVGDKFLSCLESVMLIAKFVVNFFGIHFIVSGGKLQTWCFILTLIVFIIDILLCVLDFIVAKENGGLEGGDIASIVLNCVLFLVFIINAIFAKPFFGSMLSSGGAVVNYSFTVNFFIGYVLAVVADLLLGIIVNFISGINDAE